MRNVFDVWSCFLLSQFQPLTQPFVLHLMVSPIPPDVAPRSAIFGTSQVQSYFGCMAQVDCKYVAIRLQVIKFIWLVDWHLTCFGA